MKKVITFISCLLASCLARADNGQGLSAVSSQTSAVAAYMPYVQVTCYAIAGVICIVGAFWAYYEIHSEHGNSKRAILTTIGSAICFVAMAMSLPSFFGIDSEGKITLVTGGSTSDGGNSGLANDEKGIPQSGIKTEIPEVDDPAWKKNPNSSEYTHQWMSNNGYNSGSSTDYFKVVQDASSYYFEEDYNEHRILDNYGGDVASLMSGSDGDWTKAIQNVEQQIDSAYEMEANGESGPYSHSDYQRVLDGLLAVYRYIHGYDYTP